MSDRSTFLSASFRKRRREELLESRGDRFDLVCQASALLRKRWTHHHLPGAGAGGVYLRTFGGLSSEIGEVLGQPH